MSVFIDTSAFIAVLIADDMNHNKFAKTWRALIEQDERLVTSNYVIIETLALLQRHSEMTTLHRFIEDILPAVVVEWIDENLHIVGTNSLIMSGKRGPSMVDCVSFALMRKFSISNVFTFDRYFRAQGFIIL